MFSKCSRLIFEINSNVHVRTFEWIHAIARGSRLGSRLGVQVLWVKHFLHNVKHSHLLHPQIPKCTYKPCIIFQIDTYIEEILKPNELCLAILIFMVWKIGINYLYLEFPFVSIFKNRIQNVFKTIYPKRINKKLDILFGTNYCG